jgi:hypothetical protein
MLTDPPDTRSRLYVPMDCDFVGYIQLASIVLNHYRDKSLEERIERRTLRRTAYYGVGGLDLVGEARQRFIQETIEEELARGFLTGPQEYDARDDAVKEFFQTHVEAAYNVTRQRHGMATCGESPLVRSPPLRVH